MHQLSNVILGALKRSRHRVPIVRVAPLMNAPPSDRLRIRHASSVSPTRNRAGRSIGYRRVLRVSTTLEDPFRPSRDPGVSEPADPAVPVRKTESRKRYFVNTHVIVRAQAAIHGWLPR